MNPTPNGIDGKEDSKNQNETPMPGNYSSIEPVQANIKKLGPKPPPITDIERLKLKMGLKIGLFYYQYTLLINSLKQGVMHAPRGERPRSHQNNQMQLLQRISENIENHQQPDVLADNNELIEEEKYQDDNEESKRKLMQGNQGKYQIKDNVIPSFVYTSAHTRDIDNFKAMVAELTTLDWSVMDSRDPSKFDGGGWVDIGDFCSAFDLNQQDEMSDINRPKSMLNRKKKNQVFFTQPSNLQPLNKKVEFVEMQKKEVLGQVKISTE